LNELIRSLVPDESELEPLLAFVNGPDVAGLDRDDPLYARGVLAASIRESDVVANHDPEEVRYNIFQALQYITDWLQVASEEALHFSLLADYLVAAGSAYGEYEAHNGLWDMAVKTDHDVMVRMALVPRVLEARGLDVTPGMIEQLERVGDERLVEILKVIFRDEIGHVRIGNRWYHHCCDQRGLDASETFFELLDQYMGRPLPGPFALDARREAGFSDTELELLMTRAR